MTRVGRWIVACSVVSLLFLGTVVVSAGQGHGTVLPEDAFAGEGAPAAPTETERNPFTAQRPLRAPEDVALYTAMLFLFALFVLIFVSRAVKHTTTVTVVPLARPNETVDTESDFVRESTERLKALRFLPHLDFNMPELPHHGFYRWFSTRDGSHSVIVAEIETTPKKEEKTDKQCIGYLEFQTLLDNGCRINTNNSPLASPMKPPPLYLVTAHPTVSSPRVLFDIHRADVERMRTQRGGSIWPQRPEEFVPDFTAEWRALTEYQEALGLLKRERDGMTCRGTPTLVLRALAPRAVRRPNAWWSFPVPVLGAMATLLMVWSIPKLAALTGLENFPRIVSESEAYGVLLLTACAGYLVGTGGGLIGFLCYAPCLILFERGYVSHTLLTVLAVTGGSIGEKLRNRQPHYEPPWYRLLSPEIYIAASLLILVAW